MEPHTTGAMPALASLTTWDLNVARSASQRRPSVEDLPSASFSSMKVGIGAHTPGLRLRMEPLLTVMLESISGLKTEKVYADVSGKTMSLMGSWGCSFSRRRRGTMGRPEERPGGFRWRPVRSAEQGVARRGSSWLVPRQVSACAAGAKAAAFGGYWVRHACIR